MNMNFLYSFFSSKVSIFNILSFFDPSKSKMFLPSSWIFKSTSIHLNTFPHGNNLPYLLRCSLRENESRKAKAKR